MTKRIKRIAALIIAGILLVCVSFASLAEGTEEIFDTEYTEAPAADETTEESAPAEEETVITAEMEETAEDAGNADEASEETADEGKETGDAVNEETAAAEEAEEQTETGDTAETENNVEEKTGETTETAETETEDAGDTEEAEEEYDEPADDESDEYDELADDESDEDDELADDDESDEEMEYQILDDDGGYIDPEVVSQHIPEITEELIEASDKVGQEATEETEETEETEANEDAEEAEETATVKAWIIREENGEAYIGDTITLVAKADSELNSEVYWETRDEQWDEGVWQEIGTGKKLELTITAENADNAIRFTTGDGVVSEEYRINAGERSFADAQDDMESVEGTVEETAEEGEDGGSFADAQDDTNDAQDDSDDAQDDTAEETAEETVEEPATIRAWVTVTEEDGSVTLSANADPELTGVCTWQTLNTEENKWQKIGYGDQIVIEVNDETAGNAYRFVMQDGTVSEEYAMSAAAEERSFADAQDDNIDVQDDTSDARNDTDAVEAEGRSFADAQDDNIDVQDDNIDARDDTESAPDDTTEEEIPEIPEDRSVTVVMTWEDENPGFGSVAHFAAELSGYEGLQYEFQWMMSSDNVNWVPVEGETGETMDVVVTRDNFQTYWRVDVHVTGIYVD